MVNNALKSTFILITKFLHIMLNNDRTTTTYSGRKNVVRTASKQKALAHTTVIKLHIKFRLLFSWTQIYKSIHKDNEWVCPTA